MAFLCFKAVCISLSSCDVAAVRATPCGGSSASFPASPNSLLSVPQASAMQDLNYGLYVHQVPGS